MGHVPWLGTYHAVPLNCAAPWLCEPPSDHLAARHRAPLGAIFCSRKHEKRWKLRRDLEYLRTFRQSQPFQVFIHINYYYYDYYYYIYIYTISCSTWFPPVLSKVWHHFCQGAMRCRLHDHSHGRFWTVRKPSEGIASIERFGRFDLETCP